MKGSANDALRTGLTNMPAGTSEPTGAADPPEPSGLPDAPAAPELPATEPLLADGVAAPVPEPPGAVPDAGGAEPPPLPQPAAAATRTTTETRERSRRASISVLDLSGSRRPRIPVRAVAFVGRRGSGARAARGPRARARSGSVVSLGGPPVSEGSVLDQPLQKERCHRAGFRGDPERRQRHGPAALAERPDVRGRRMDPADEHAGRDLVAVPGGVIAEEDVIREHFLVGEIKGIAIGESGQRVVQDPAPARDPIALPWRPLAGPARVGESAQMDVHATREV